MTDRCYLDPKCERGLHAAHEMPCGGPPHVPGSPCEFCGKPTPAGGGPCPDCWIDLTTLPLADQKALLALGDLSVDLS